MFGKPMFRIVALSLSLPMSMGALLLSSSESSSENCGILNLDTLPPSFLLKAESLMGTSFSSLSSLMSSRD